MSTNITYQCLNTSNIKGTNNEVNHNNLEYRFPGTFVKYFQAVQSNLKIQINNFEMASILINSTMVAT